MLKKTFFFSIFLFGFNANSQNHKEQATPVKDSISLVELNRALITNCINDLFDGMKTGDSTLVREVLSPEIRLQTTFTARNGEIVLKTESAEDFLEAIGTPRKELWNEVISNLKIDVDGSLGQAWMDYSFYLNDEFSHCGVNAMQFVYDGESWKIIQIIDTRRRTDCNKKSDLK